MWTRKEVIVLEQVKNYFVGVETVNLSVTFEPWPDADNKPAKQDLEGERNRQINQQENCWRQN